MQRVPAVAELADGPAVGGEREGQEHGKPRHAEHDIGPLQNIAGDGADDQAAVQHQIDREMRQHVIKGDQPQRPAIGDEVDVEQVSQRRHQKPNAEEA
ncbi:hypothetical protein D3C80_990000 [compost metagenome]